MKQLQHLQHQLSKRHKRQQCSTSHSSAARQPRPPRPRHLREWIMILIYLIFLINPHKIFAQAPTSIDEQGIALPPEGISFETIPDKMGYISLSIPQCNDCNGIGKNFSYEEATFPQHDWIYWIDPRNFASIIGEFFSWMLKSIRNLFVWLICILFSIFQHLANWISIAINAIIFMLNFMWRIAIYLILILRGWFYSGWYLFERLRIFWQQTLIILALVGNYILILIEAIKAVVATLVASLSLIMQSILRLIGLIAYFIGFFGDFILSFLAALKGQTAPIELQTKLQSNGPFFYSFTRGVLDAIFSSEIAWMPNIVLALANLSALVGAIKSFRK